MLPTFFLCLYISAVWLWFVRRGHAFLWVCLDQVQAASSVCRVVSLANPGRFPVIISSNSISATYSFSHSGTFMTWVLEHLLLSDKSSGLCSFFFNHFSFCCSDWTVSIDLSSNSLALHHFCFTTACVKWAFYFRYWFFSYKISISFFFISFVSWYFLC